jgi:ankyrin repeat protein
LEAAILGEMPDSMGRSDLHYAALENDDSTVVALILEGHDPNAADQAGSTPLHFAAQSGAVRAAEALLDHGATVDPTDRHRNTPLWTAVFNSRGNGELIRLLRSRSADCLHRNESGKTPVDLARTIANFQVARFFEDLP